MGRVTTWGTGKGGGGARSKQSCVFPPYPAGSDTSAGSLGAGGEFCAWDAREERGGVLPLYQVLS